MERKWNARDVKAINHVKMDLQKDANATNVGAVSFAIQ